MTESGEKEAREFFKQAAESEGLSLRAYCRKYGIVYESFFGRDDIDDIPGKVYLSQLLPRSHGSNDEGVD
jgi:hypothetical protein